jgi:PAS domain S-box-containing protein
MVPSPELRKELLEGFVYAPFRADDLLSGIFGAETHPRVDVEVYEGTVISPAHLLHGSKLLRGAREYYKPRFTTTKNLQVAGRTWALLFVTRPEFDLASGRNLLGLVLTGGLLVSAGLFLVTRSQVKARVDAERTALALKQSESRARQLMESNVIGVLFLSSSGQIVDANDAFLKIVGHGRGDLLAGTVRWTDMTPHQHQETDRQMLAQFVASGECAPYEKELIRKDGSCVPVLVGLAKVEGSQDQYVGFVLDLSEQKRTEAERLHLLAREQNARIEAETLNQVGRIAAAELDLHKLVEAVTNAATGAAAAEFGAFFYNAVDEKGETYSLFSLVGAPREAFEKFPRPRITPLFEPTFRGERVIRSADITNDPLYGRNSPHKGMPLGHLPVRSYLAVPVKSRSGRVLGGLFFGHQQAGVFTEREERIVVGIAAQAGIAMDNAQLYQEARLARQSAEEASRTKDEFVANLSHELRTPLNAILGWTQLLQMGTLDPADVQEGLETIGRNAKIQSQLVEDLLDIARIVSGKLRLDVQDVDLTEVIQAAIESVQPTAQAKGVRLLQTLDPAAARVSGDPGRLQQVVWNILTNAIKFTPRAGRVHVHLQRMYSEAQIVITDTGQGIKRDFLPFVFERFRQADSTTTRTHGGLGLGLAIVRHLVELHGGTVEAASPGEAQGSTFTIRLPLAAVRCAPPVTQKPDRGNGDEQKYATKIDLSGVRVLVVDDELDARRLLGTLLERCGAKVVCVASVDEALEQISRSRPDVLVSDIGMPGEDGYALIRRVREREGDSQQKLPAIALTAFARSEDRRKAMLAGFQMHVPKPVEAEELTAVVASLAGKRTVV